tara:strand:+ start:568 stop:873 length:306 start_codon:yes stop_codon:yes gene_type:complete
MTDNNTFYTDFDWDADTEEMEPREFRLAYEQVDNEFPDPELLEQDSSFLPQMGLEPESIAEEASSGSRTAIPNKKLHSRRRIMFEHLLQFFSNSLSRYRLF